jgi:hypothetical protein
LLYANDWGRLALFSKIGCGSEVKVPIPDIPGVVGSSLDFFIPSFIFWKYPKSRLVDYHHSYFGNIQKVGWLITIIHILENPKSRLVDCNGKFPKEGG